MTLDEVKDTIIEFGGAEDALVMDDFAESCIGVSEDGRAVYSYYLMLEEFMEKNGGTVDEAIEYLDFNTLRAIEYMGEMRPIMVYLFPQFT